MCSAVTALYMDAAPVLALPPTGTLDTSSTIFPAHLVPASIRKDILEGKDVNLASLLISVHGLAENKSYAWGDVSVVLKAKDPRLNHKLSITKFVLAFGMFRDMLFLANPGRREEMDLYLHVVVDLGYKYGGSAFYDYHRSFAARAAAKLLSSKPAQIGVSWSPSCSAATLQVCVSCFAPFASPPRIRQTGALTWTPDVS